MLRRPHVLVRERIEDSLAQRNILYPWWVPFTCFVGQVTCVVVALVMRDALWPLQPLTLTLALVLFSPAMHFLLLRWLPWWLDGLGAVVAATWLMLHPLDGVLDLAPSLLGLVTAEVVARDGIRPGAVVGAASLGLLTVVTVTVGIAGYPVHMLEVLLGFVVGAMLLWQMRALAAEREARERAWAQATTAERERIAREIHDLVAHSLSVSLLHVTGARHALRDVGEAGSGADAAAVVAEVDAALADAEQVGRRAMADIRRTVSAMADGTGDRQPLPGATDIAALAAEMDVAGLHVDYDEQGDPGLLPDHVGLGLYRIAQESLTNVAKHADGASARMRLEVTRGGARLRVRSLLAAARPRTDSLGSGLAGMHARAAQLGATLVAGPDDGDWLVDVRLGDLDPEPVRTGRIELPCGHAVGLPRSVRP